MSHTSQRRGLDPDHPGREMIVLAMIPTEYKDKPGIGAAMAELGLLMLRHAPANWILHNFTETDIPNLGSAQKLFEWMHESSPQAADRLLMRLAAQRSSVITALYTDTRNVVDLIQELKKDWLNNNQRQGFPISIVLSGLFKDIRQCAERTRTREHTYLHSLGFFGKLSDLPGPEEMELITMCGHGLISINRVRELAGRIRKGAISPADAGKQLERPCVCGIVNSERAKAIFARLAARDKP